MFRVNDGVGSFWELECRVVASCVVSVDVKGEDCGVVSVDVEGE